MRVKKKEETLAAIINGKVDSREKLREKANEN